MKNSNNPTDKLPSIIPGGIFGIISCIIYLSGDIISIILFPGGYSFFKNMISELGTGPYGIFFNLGLILSGLLAFPYYLALSRMFNPDEINPNLIKGAIISAYISVVCYIFVGVFPSIEENYIIYISHGTFAFFSMTSGTIYLIIFSILMFKDKKYSKLQASHGFVVAGTYILFLLTWIPITEWIATFAILSWISVNSIFLLYKKSQ